MTKALWRPGTVALLLLAVSTVWIGCKRPEQNIGLGIQPEDDILNAHQTDTTTLVAYTLKEDSLRMDDFSMSMLGSHMDPIFGRSSASIYTQLRLSTSNVDFGDTDAIEVDSLVLFIAYGDEIYGAPNPQQFAVREILDQLHLDSIYYSNQSLEVGTQNYVLDQLNATEIDPNGLVQVGEESHTGLLRLPLNTDLAQKFLDVSGTDSLSDNESFSSFFGGLHISSLTPDAAILQMDVINPLSNMTMYYRTTGDDADTLTYIFDLNVNAARFTSWDHNYGDNLTPLAFADTMEADPHTYIRAGACAKTGIKFPFLRDYTAIDGIIINKAELIVPATVDPFGRLANQSYIFTRTTDEDGITVELPDANTFNFITGGEFDEENEEYRFIITRYIQEIISGERPDRGMTLISNNGAVSARRVVLNGPSVSDDDSSKNMRLILTLSE